MLFSDVLLSCLVQLYNFNCIVSSNSRSRCLVLAYADFSFTENTCTVKVKARSENFCLSGNLSNFARKTPDFWEQEPSGTQWFIQKKELTCITFLLFLKFFLGGRGEGEGIILMDQGKEKVCSFRHSLHLSCLNSSQG